MQSVTRGPHCQRPLGCRWVEPLNAGAPEPAVQSHHAREQGSSGCTCGPRQGLSGADCPQHSPCDQREECGRGECPPPGFRGDQQSGSHPGFHSLSACDLCFIPWTVRERNCFSASRSSQPNMFPITSAPFTYCSVGQTQPALCP